MTEKAGGCWIFAAGFVATLLLSVVLNFAAPVLWIAVYLAGSLILVFSRNRILRSAAAGSLLAVICSILVLAVVMLVHKL